MVGFGNEEEPLCTHFICDCNGDDLDCRTCGGAGHYFEDEFGRATPGNKYWSHNFRKDTINCECGHSFTITRSCLDNAWFCPFCDKRGVDK